jgi:hypothetical protein
MSPDEIDISKLLDKALEIVRMDINHLYKEAVSGKLNPAGARDISNYVKLLSEAEERQKILAAEAARIEAARAGQSEPKV